MTKKTVTAKDILAIGKRVQISPGLDLWMRGARYGEIKNVSKNGVYTIQLDKYPRPIRLKKDRFTFND